MNTKCFNILRAAAKEFDIDLSPEKYAWISIQEPDLGAASFPHIKNKYLDRLNNLKIKFADVSIPCLKAPGIVHYPPSEADAKQIVDFILANSGKTIIVNCAAGIARSGAICEFLEKYMGYTWPKNFKRYATPNRVLFNRLAQYYNSLYKTNVHEIYNTQSELSGGYRSGKKFETAF